LDGGVEAELRGRRPAVFADYDGTLTPIVPHPSQAVLSGEMRAVLASLAARHPMAIISGRDRADVEQMVGLDNVYYAGSHGFDISGPDGFRRRFGDEFVHDLEEAGRFLDQAVSTVEGAWVEHKRLALAVHFRQADPADEDGLRKMVADAAARAGNLRMSGGKKIFEIRPDFDWDKGRALLLLVGELGLDRPEVVPLYLGDDETDEDAFRVLEKRGIGVCVGVEDRITLARYELSDPDQVCRFLERLAQEPS
ncbi:MAG: trehalose-phosphatase, partial [Acidimicrobiia bacterium]